MPRRQRSSKTMGSSSPTGDIGTSLIPHDNVDHAHEEHKGSTQHSDKSSDMQSIVNMILTAVGVGLLALPRAVAQSGWIGASVLIVVSVALAHFTVWMIWSCMRTDPKNIISYQDIGERCYGSRGYYLVAVPLFLDLLAVCAMLMILVGSGMAIIVPQYSQQMWTLFYTVTMLPLTWLPGMKEIGAISAIGLVAAALVAVVIVLAGIDEAGRADNGHDHAMGPASSTALGLAFSDYMNSYTVAPVVPTIIAGMREPDHFPRVSCIALAVITLFFGTIGFAGYAGWGMDLLSCSNIVDAVRSSKQYSESADVYNHVIQIAILVVCLCHFLVMFNPAALAAERMYCDWRHARRLQADATSPAVSNPNPGWAARIILRTLLVAFCFLIASTIPDFGKLVDLVGSALVMLLQIIFPVVFYLRLCVGAKGALPLGLSINPGSGSKHFIADKHGCLSRNALFAAMAVAVCLGIFGMVFGLYGVVQEFQSTNTTHASNIRTNFSCT
eukprot:m.1112988 g.1112988  ORF g.1112988 m.1112988 type:complete len:499 (+) comp24362_c0_seq85:374-1870(+)